MQKLENLKIIAFRNFEEINLFKAKKFNKKFLPFLNYYLEKAYQAGCNFSSIKDILEEVDKKYSEFKNNRNYDDFSSIAILLNKWLIEAYNQGKNKK